MIIPPLYIFIIQNIYIIRFCLYFFTFRTTVGWVQVYAQSFNKYGVNINILFNIISDFRLAIWKIKFLELFMCDSKTNINKRKNIENVYNGLVNS